MAQQLMLNVDADAEEYGMAMCELLAAVKPVLAVERKTVVSVG